jgi:hypothetical protein
VADALKLLAARDKHGVLLFKGTLLVHGLLDVFRHLLARFLSRLEPFEEVQLLYELFQDALDFESFEGRNSHLSV